MECCLTIFQSVQQNHPHCLQTFLQQHVPLGGTYQLAIDLNHDACSVLIARAQISQLVYMLGASQLSTDRVRWSGLSTRARVRTPPLSSRVPLGHEVLDWQTSMSNARALAPEAASVNGATTDFNTPKECAPLEAVLPLSKNKYFVPTLSSAHRMRNPQAPHARR